MPGFSVRTPTASRTFKGSFVISKPATLAEPSLGAIRQDRSLTVVVFPEPFGPRRPKISPGSTLKLNRSTAVRAPKRLLSPSATMPDMTVLLASFTPPI